MSEVASASHTAGRCLHCGDRLPDRAGDAYCCSGCRTVHALLTGGGLDRYYAIRGTNGPRGLDAAPASRDRKWLDAQELRLADAADAQGLVRITVDVQGIQCAACVWLINELFTRAGGADIAINPTLGTIDLVVARGFPLRAFVEDVERFGYRIGPRRKGGDDAQSSLLLRMGVCLAIAMNSMIFALALYLGLDDGPIYTLMHRVAFGLSTLSVVVGGSVFIESSWRALRRGVLHMDAPIALGMLLAFLGSAFAFFFGDRDATYFDTVSIFIALMLVGRFLQERVLERNRRALLADDGVAGLLARRIEGSGVAIVPCGSLREGDRLLIAPGDIVPVDATLTRDASLSLDWISGEAVPRVFRSGDAAPAGAVNAGDRAIEVRASSAFDASPLVSLLRTPRERDVDGARATPFWQALSRWYVSGVLVVATIGGIAWVAITGDVVRTLDVVTAVLVVTCPCALGIATPLAYEMVQAGLRRAGLFVRSSGFLDRACDVRKVVFDKTGTLTTGGLVVRDPSALRALDADSRAILWNLVVRSAHPKSAAVARAIEAFDKPAFRETKAVEVTGAGIEASIDGATYRIGARYFALGRGAPHLEEAGAADLVFSRDGVALCELHTDEQLRPDARAELRQLEAEQYEVYVLSGDSEPRVKALAAEIGIPPRRAFGAASPSAKAAFIAAHDRRDMLMIGDGLNDSLAVGDAFCSGTPTIERPFLPSRADFYFVTPGLGPIRMALRAARALRWITRRNLCIAVAYNVLAVSLCLAGVMRPWLAAAMMPASSLLVIFATLASLSKRSSLWKS